jgi:Tol biopolymer transport system component
MPFLVSSPICAAALLLAVLPSTMPGQYFGQNKVQYEPHDFKVLKTPRFDVYYYDQERQGAVDAGRMAERWNTRHSKVLAWQLSPNQPVILYDSPIAFQSTTVLPGFIGEGTGGVTEALRRRVVMPLAGPLAETDHVLGHELVHAFQYDIAARAGPRGGSGAPGLISMPLWFIEGMAEYLSLGAKDPLTAMWMRDAVRREEIPSIDQLNNPKYFPYRYGQAFWAFVGGRYGDEAIGKIFKVSGTAGVEAAISRVLGISAAELSKQWRAALIDEYEPVLKLTQRAEDTARVLIPAKREGDLNVGPAVSPDGSRMMLFSQRDIFSIDIYLADATTGKFERRITKAAVDPHLNSLGFINSAGSWSADGREFAYPTISNGRAQLAIYDVQAHQTVRRINLPQFGEIQSPTWSPDARQIAFAALVGGLNDLYVIDLKSSQVRRLTKDEFGDFQPAWSPDGTRIAFVTDRFTSELDDLSFGQYRLGLIDVASGAVQEGPGFRTGKHINPQWSPDSRSLYFISDRDGISNIYRVSLAGRDLYQLTNLQTGVSGITALSPALSVASKADRILFSVFSTGNYGIFAIDEPGPLSGRPPTDTVAPLNAGLLPPRIRTSQAVATLLAQPHVGLVNPAAFRVTPYRARLSLDYIAPPSVGIGISNFGTMVSGGAAFYFSDILGYHNLMTAVESTTFSEDARLANSISGIVAYQNQRHRWTWGAIGGQIPYLTGGYGQAIANVDGQPTILEQSILFWQINRQAAGIVTYPFNRAQRVEFSAGFQNISYDARLTTNAFSAITGEFLGQQKQDLPKPNNINLGFASTALVYDTSVFGGTSPVAGQSYRLEFGGFSGTLTYTTALADYRRYFRISRALTLAFRGLHYGRYGGGSNDARLEDLFLGYPTLVRGYDPGSFDPRECGPQSQTTGTCPVFDRLIGNRIAVGNAELRIPLLGFLGVIPSRTLPPVEIAPFYDAGIAWNRRQQVPRRAIRSWGASLRLNVFGFAVAQISYVHPVDRPAKSWMWEFALVPGF